MARRRSTDVPSSSAALAFASSNATLNAFLGGRQRAWMHGGELPPLGDNGLNQHMPPPRPLAAPPHIDNPNEPSSPTLPTLAGTVPPIPNTSKPTNRTISVAATRNEASPSTSPALANIQPPPSIQTRSDSASAHYASFDILPSPTPSDECNRVENSLGRAEVDISRGQGAVIPNAFDAQAIAQVFPQIPVSAPAPASTPNPTIASTPTSTLSSAPVSVPAPVQPRPEGSETFLKRATHFNIPHPNKRLRTEDSTPATNFTLPNILSGTAVTTHKTSSSLLIAPSDQPYGSHAQTVFPSTIMNSQKQHQPASQNATTQKSRSTVTLPQQALVPSQSTSPPIPILPQSPSRTNPFPENTVFPNGDPRTVQMNRIRHFLTNIGGRQNLQPDYAKSRLSTLCIAVISGDMLYLILHQMFCLWSTKPHDIPGSIRTNPGFNGLMAFLTEILCPNENLNQSVLTFFSQFPEPLQQFVLNSSSALEILQQITMLINGMQQKNALIQYCMQRKYPPLFIELRDVLCIQSDRLMEIVFTAILRQLWGQLASYNNSIYDLARKVFQNDVSMHKQAAASGSLPLDQNVTIHNYLSLYNQLRETVTQSQAVQVSTQSQMYQQYGPNTMHMSSSGSGSSSTRPILPVSAQHATTSQSMIQQSQIRRTPVSSDSRQISNHSHLNNSQATTNLNWASGITTQEILPLQNINRSIYDFSLIPLATPATPNPESALHQTHLRSPILKDENLLQTTTTAPRLYQFITDFAITPHRLVKGSIIQEFRFVVQDWQYNNIPKTQYFETGQRPLRHLNVGHLQYRLRACSRKGEDQFSTFEWISTETHWPVNFYWEFNGEGLECRRKQHYSKDLPIDLTHLVTRGENRIVVYVNTLHDDPHIALLNVAVEIIEVKDHATIISEVLSRKWSVADVKAAIKSRIAGGAVNNNDNDDDDDDVVITSSKFNINLFDPISASQIFTIPVRGKSCAHFDCFDLETFLNSRPSKVPGWPSQVDVWRCPICRGDARPQCLVVDYFMLEVRKALEDQGKLDTRVITIGEDGNWKPRDVEIGDIGKTSMVPSYANDTKEQAAIEANKEMQAQPGAVIDLLD